MNDMPGWIQDSLSTSRYLAVVAIDFGTTYSGYAFAFQHQYKKIYTSSSNRKLLKDRVPTSILIKPDRSFDSFGHEAEEKYTKLSETGEHKAWYYFPHFKMMLYKTKELHRNVTLRDSQGHGMYAMTAFAMAIQYLKKTAQQAVQDSISSIKDSDIQWIITVPAIWSDSAKQFMREAAVMAGIGGNHLRLVLEPEAASLFCKEQPLTRVVNEDNQPCVEKLEVGHTYILADLGGGTADICVHCIVAEGNLREIYRATGGALGAIRVDKAFQQMCVDIVGEQTWKNFKVEFMDEYLDLMQRFETKKAEFSMSNRKETTFSLPVGLLTVVRDNHKVGIRDLIQESTYAKMVSVDKRNRLKVSWKAMESFFKPTVDGIIQLLKGILEQPECKTTVHTLLLVGGFSESPYLRETIKDELPIKVIFPLEGSLAVIKGAVLMGFRPRTITERRSRYTYGFDIRKTFRDGVHPEELRTERDGRQICKGIFDKQIEVGQVLKYGQVFEYRKKGSSTTEETKHEMRYVSLWRSSRKDPQYCTEAEDCSCVGEISMKPPAKGWPDSVVYRINIVVGEAEFVVKVFNETTGSEYAAKMEFL